MANSIDFNGIVKSKYTFYIMLFLSATNLFGYISKKKYNSILIFILSGFLFKNIYKNTNIVLILALIISTFYTMFYYKKEGLTDHHPVNNIYHNTATVATTTSEDTDSDTDDEEEEEEVQVETEVFLNINEFIYLLYDIDPPIWSLDDAGLVTNANYWGGVLLARHDTTGKGGLNATELKTALDSISFEITEEYANELVTEYRGSYTSEVLATSPVFESQRAEAAENTTTETTDETTTETTDEDTYVTMSLFCTNFINYQKRLIDGGAAYNGSKIASWYNHDENGDNDEDNITACKNNMTAAAQALTGLTDYAPANWDTCATGSNTFEDYMSCNGRADYEGRYTTSDVDSTDPAPAEDIYAMCNGTTQSDTVPAKDYCENYYDALNNWGNEDAWPAWGDVTKDTDKDTWVKYCADNILGDAKQDTRSNCCNLNFDTWQGVNDCNDETNANPPSFF